MLLALVLGLISGFVGSIPVAGPMAALVLERGLAGRYKEGFAISVGASIAEAVYAGSAFLGMTAMLGRFPWMVPVSRVFGAGILFFLGLYFALRKGKSKKERDEEQKREDAKEETSVAKKRGGPFVLGLLLTGLNPTLLVSWSAAVTMLHSLARLHSDLVDAVPFGLGVMGGIIGWFGSFLFLLQKFRDKVKDETLDKVVRGIGWALCIGGVVVGVRLGLTWKNE